MALIHSPIICYGISINKRKTIFKFDYDFHSKIGTYVSIPKYVLHYLQAMSRAKLECNVTLLQHTRNCLAIHLEYSMASTLV